MRKQNRKISGKSSEAMAFAPVVRGENKLEVFNAGETHEIVLLGAVGKSWWDDSGITEKEFRDALKTIPTGKPINVKVNSEGGSVQEGLGIYNAIKERSKDITVTITGYALSIASVFPLAASRVVSPKSAIWMIHCAWSWASGNAADMRKQAEMLDIHDETLLNIYEDNTGKSRAELRAAMEEETWFSGAEAVDFGLADETDEADAQASYRPLSGDYLKRCKNAHPTILAAQSSAPSKPLAKTQPDDSAALISDHHPSQIIINNLPLSGQPPESVTTNQNPHTTMPEAITPAAAQPAASNGDVLAQVQAQLASERKARITDRVTRASENKIPNDKLAWWIDNAMKDEAGTLAQIESLPAARVGSDPLGSVVEMSEPGEGVVNANGVHGSKVLPEMDNLFKRHQDPAARYNAMKQEFPRLLKAAFRKDNGVQAANTMSATVMTNFLILAVTNKLSGKFAAAGLFTKDAEQDPYKPLASGIRKFNTTTTDGSKVSINPTNFATLAGGTNGNPDSVVDAVTIDPDYYASGGHLTFTQLNSGFRVADIFESKLRDLAAKIAQVITAPITVANFTTNAAVVSSPEAFGFSELADLQGKLKKSNVKNIILDGEYIARVANTPGFYQMAGTVGGATNAWKAFGWDNIALHTDWSGAGANVRGFACGDQAIGIIAGIPVDFPEGIPGNTLQRINVKIPDVDLVISNFVWFDLNERVYRFTNDIILGATLLDETDGCLVKSA